MSRGYVDEFYIYRHIMSGEARSSGRRATALHGPRMKLAWFALALLAPMAALADDSCDRATTTPEINECARSEYQAADEKLGAVYRAALERIRLRLADAQQGADASKGLIQAQRLWGRFRDQDCGAVYELWRDGTIRGVMYWACMAERTEQRMAQLESLAAGE